jgi:hypothetical protein
MPIYDYRIANNWDISLGSLANVETMLKPYTGNRSIAPVSQFLEPFPIRERTLDGVERGEGTLSIVWTFRALPLAAFQYLIDTFFTVSGAQVASRQVTIYTRNHKFQYARYNANVQRPVVGAEYSHRKGFVVDITIRFDGLVAL